MVFLKDFFGKVNFKKEVTVETTKKYAQLRSMHELKSKYEPRRCDFQQCGVLTSVDLDEPVQPPFKLGNSNDVQIYFTLPS